MLVIGHLLGVLAAVELDNQPVLRTHKIHNVASHGLLPFEFQPHETMRPQVIPQALLGVSLVTAQGFRVV